MKLIRLNADIEIHSDLADATDEVLDAFATAIMADANLRSIVRRELEWLREAAKAQAIAGEKWRKSEDKPVTIRERRPRQV